MKSEIPGNGPLHHDDGGWRSNAVEQAKKYRERLQPERPANSQSGSTAKPDAGHKHPPGKTLVALDSLTPTPPLPVNALQDLPIPSKISLAIPSSCILNHQKVRGSNSLLPHGSALSISLHIAGNHPKYFVIQTVLFRT